MNSTLNRFSLVGLILIGILYYGIGFRFYHFTYTLSYEEAPDKSVTISSPLHRLTLVQVFNLSNFVEQLGTTKSTSLKTEKQQRFQILAVAFSVL